MKNLEVYRCPRCGLQIEIVAAGAPDVKAPLCCGIPMVLQKDNATDGVKEKHVPVVEVQENGILVKVGSVPHPMTEDHYIEWIEAVNGSYSTRCFLHPGDLPQAAFDVPFGPKLVVRASCNKHGVWKNA